jgi:K+-transporting ATPase ATPase A chain
MWFLPVSVVVFTTIVAIPLSRYMAWIMDGKYQPPRWLRWFEERIGTGPQTWTQYAAALLVFNGVLFVFGFLVLSLQPWLPLNPEHKGMLSPSTIFDAVVSFMTNTNIQHYSGEVHFSNFSQIFFCISNFFLSAAVGLSAFAALIRAIRGDAHVGNYFVDMWRTIAYLMLPLALVLAVVFVQQGMPMTYRSIVSAATLEPGAMKEGVQRIAIGPLAAFVPGKMLGTNGGGFFGANAAHPFENPTGLTNFLTMFAMMVFPFSLPLMYGRMLGRLKHAGVIFCVMLAMFAGTVVWAIHFDTRRPNPGIAGAPVARTFELPETGVQGAPRAVTVPAVASLPVDQHLGNLEGKELRFGTSAGATFAAVTVDVTCGAENAEPDSLNPMAGLSPMMGMWLNCVYGGKGVGMINLLVYLVIGIFLAGLMVGRTPEYLGKKIGAREMKLAMISLLVHPMLILGASGLFAATHWGLAAISNPGAHGLSQIVYQFSSSSANNGSAFDGLGVVYGFNDNPHPAPTAVAWDVASGIVMFIGRYFPILAPLAMAASLGAKKSTPPGLGTLRDDTFTFGCLLLGTILVIGALLFLPVAALGPIAEHLGPIPFGG